MQFGFGFKCVFCNFGAYNGRKVLYNKACMKHFLPIIALLAMLAASCGGRTAVTASADRQAVEPHTEAVAAVTFNADSAYANVAAQVAFGPRVPGSAAHGECARWLEAELVRHGADTVMVQEANIVSPLTGKPIKAKNIFAQYNPGAPKRVLLLAHWDTRPVADEDRRTERRDTPIDGANDGASGVGVILELARMLGVDSARIGVDILLVDAEDSGVHADDQSWALGTQDWVRNMPYGHSALPAYGILLDMVGGRDARFGREYFSERFAPAVLDKVWATARAKGHGRIFVSEPGGAVTDDHIHINGAGIPCIDIIDASHPATGSFNPTWHTTDDNLDNIDVNTLRAVGETVAAVIYNER